jgi:hypothetical protein
MVASLMATAPLGAVATISTVSASPASASFIGIKCQSLLGTLTTSVTFFVCMGNTGGSSKPFSPTLLATGGTITWANGDTTTVSVTVSSGGKAGGCPNSETEFTSKGMSSADTTGSAPVGGKVKIQWCLSEQTITIAQGTAVKVG